MSRSAKSPNSGTTGRSRTLASNIRSVVSQVPGAVAYGRGAKDGVVLPCEKITVDLRPEIRGVPEGNRTPIAGLRDQCTGRCATGTIGGQVRVWDLQGVSAGLGGPVRHGAWSTSITQTAGPLGWVEGSRTLVLRLTGDRSAIELRPRKIVEPPGGIEPLGAGVQDRCPPRRHREAQSDPLAPAAERAGRCRPMRDRLFYARMKSAMTVGAAVSKPTTSIMPASSGSAMLNPLDTMPTTISLAAMPVSRR